MRKVEKYFPIQPQWAVEECLRDLSSIQAIKTAKGVKTLMF